MEDMEVIHLPKALVKATRWLNGLRDRSTRVLLGLGDRLRGAVSV
jgi:hypothetical protein